MIAASKATGFGSGTTENIPHAVLTLEEKALVPELRKPFDVLARGLVGAGREDGEGKGTRLELFAEGVVGLAPQILELIRAA